MYKNSIGNKSVTPLKKSDYINNSNSKLSYFYEPRANTVQHPVDYLSFKANYHINRDSLNSIKDYLIEKKIDTFRIITIGDSFTFGVNVDTKDNWTSQLEVLLNNKNKCSSSTNYEVINLGVGGYDFEYAVERYRLRGQKYKPDLVLWLMTDFDRIYEKVYPLSNKYYEEYRVSGKLAQLVAAGRPYEAFTRAKEQVKKELGVEGISEYQKNSI